MFESMTYEALMEDMLSRVPDSLDRREGSVIFDALAPVAAELARMYAECDRMLDESFADTASRDYLIRRCAERGIVPQKEVAAIVEGTFNCQIPMDARFTCGAVSYVNQGLIRPTSSGYVYSLVCETGGTVGNIASGVLRATSYIQDLGQAMITKISRYGRDEEDTESLRKRYFQTFALHAFGGNAADYKEKLLAMDKVGAVRIFPCKYGPGTVGIAYLDENMQSPQSSAIAAIQAVIDPLENSGQGLGFAPIGHAVTVRAADTVAITVRAKFTYASQNIAFTDIETAAEEAINHYFADLCRAWNDGENAVIRIAHIQRALLSVDGITDVRVIDLKAAGGTAQTENITLTDTQIPSLDSLVEVSA